MSNKDTAAFAVKEALEKYGLSNEDPINYCLVQIVTPINVNKDNYAKEFVLEDDACPLANLIKHLSTSGSIIFQIRRCPPDILNKKKLEQQSKSQISQLKTASSFLSNKNSQSRINSASTCNSFINNLKMSTHSGLPGLLEFSDSNVDDLLFQISNNHQSISEFKLEPFYIMYMMLRYKLSDKYTEDNLGFSEKLLNLSPLIHKMVDIIRKTINLNHLNQLALAYWLANASEFLNIVKNDKDLSQISQDSQETLIGCLQMAFYYLINLTQKKLDFLLNEFINPYEEDDSDNEIRKNDVNKDSAIKKMIKVLNESINLFRNSKVNNGLIFQLFSQYFHYINVWLFNKLVNHDNQNSICTRSWGSILNNFLEKIKLWAVKQGLDLIYKNHFYKIIQAKILLQASKYDLNELSILSSKCFSLNSLQISAIIKNYVLEENELPISYQLVNDLISTAKLNADEILKSNEKLVQIEEDFDFKDSLVVPGDGYSIDKVKGLPLELLDFIENLQSLNLCCLLKNDQGVSNSWTEEFITIVEDNKSTFTNSVFIEQSDSYEIRSVNVTDDKLSESTITFESSSILQNLEIIKINLLKQNDSVGINIIGIEEKNHSGIYIKSLIKGSPAYLDGRLKKGDLLISINDYNLIGMGVEKAAELFNKCGSNVCLKVGKKAAYLERMNSSIRKKLGIKPKSKPSLPSFS
jgi:afadin